MDAVSLLPPYAHLTEEAVRCVAEASSRYGVPELLMHAVLLKENGRTGRCSRNKGRDGKKETYDCGLAQINSDWSEHFKRYNIQFEHIRDNACLNIQASAYILKRYYIRKEADWFKAVVSYNIGPNNWTPPRYTVGHRYASDVVSRWWQLHHWVVANNPTISKESPVVSIAPAQAGTTRAN